MSVWSSDLYKIVVLIQSSSWHTHCPLNSNWSLYWSIVNEDDYEFSDDSIDYSISPVENNTNISNETTKLEEILSSVKTKSDITNLIKKSVGSKPVKLKIRLEKDMKSILLMMKFLNISSWSRILIWF